METKEILDRISLLIEEITDIHIRIRTESKNIKDIDLELMNNKSVELYDYVQKLKQLDFDSSRIQNTVETQQKEKENRFTYTSDEGLELLEDDKTDKTEISTQKDIKERDNESEKAENTDKEIDDEVKAKDNLDENDLKKEAQQSHLFEQEESDFKEKDIESDIESESESESKKNSEKESQDEFESTLNENLDVKNKPKETVHESVKSESSQTDNKASQNKTSINERFSGMHTSSLNEKFSRENMNRMLADKLKLTPVSDLKSAISINQQAAFIDQLFKGNKKEYKRSIEFLNKCGNYSEAKFYIHSELSNKYQWKVDNKLVEELIELVYRRFL